MPELPEVESVRLGLKKVLLNKVILDVEILEGKIVASHSNIRKASVNKNKEFVAGIRNKKIIDIKRRAKNIIIILDDDSVIVVHLKMTGQLIFTKIKKEVNKHTHVIFKLEHGNLYYNDVRKFGYVLYYKDIESAVTNRHFEKIGAEPFDNDFTLEYFTEALKKKNKNIKTTLLEQSIVVGCGNIYADEICFASKVLPSRPCNSLNKKEVSALYANIKSILSNAINSGGSSISDYLLADGSRGSYASQHKVYGKAGQLCRTKNCNTTLQKSIISGRSTVYCVRCQK